MEDNHTGDQGGKVDRQLSQVDKVVEEEVVLPEMMRPNDDDDNDDSGCTSDGDHSDTEDLSPSPVNNANKKSAPIVRQNTYTVNSGESEILSPNSRLPSLR